MSYLGGESKDGLGAIFKHGLKVPIIPVVAGF